MSSLVRALLLVGMVGLLAAGCTSDDAARPERALGLDVAPEQQTTFTVADDGGSGELAGAEVEVPGGALDEGGRVSLTATRLQDSAATLSKRRVAETPGPVRIQASGELDGEIRLSWPVEADDGETVWVVRRSRQGVWRPRPATVEDGHVSVRTDVLSSWDVVRDVGSGISFTVSDVLGNRADPPSCGGSWPQWVTDVTTVRALNAPLLACGEAADDGSGDLLLTVAANRGYSMVMELPEGVTVEEPGGTVDLGQAVAVALQQQTSAVVIPATEEVVLRVAERARAGKVLLETTPSPWSVAVDAIQGVLAAYDIDEPEATQLWQCVAGTLEATGTAAQIAEPAVQAARDCATQNLDEAGEQVVAAFGRVLAGMTAVDVGTSSVEAALDTGFDFAWVSVHARGLDTPTAERTHPSQEDESPEDESSSADRPPEGGPAEPAPGLDTDSPVMLVVDTSGSMAEDDGTGSIKIEGAKTALLRFLDDTDPQTRLGLRTYGGNCDPGRLQFPVAQRDPARTAAKIRTLQTGGNTPTAEALQAAADDLRAAGDTAGVIILVSDGESNCNDPCETAQDIRASGLDIRVISVGFQVSGPGQEELSCIADATGGDTVAADDNQALVDTVSDLTGPQLALDLEYDDRIPAKTSPLDAPPQITATITNDGEFAARDTRLFIRFPDPGGPRVSPMYHAVGNLTPDATRTVAWQLRPWFGDAGDAYPFEVTAQADNLDQRATVAGEVAVDLSPVRAQAGPVLAEADRIAIMGDSFSAGEGVGNYLPGTDTGDQCHRSSDTYLMGEFSIPSKLNLACSGAVARDVRGEHPTSPLADAVNRIKGWLPGREDQATSQVDALRKRQEAGGPVDLVVLTVGGNDAGFATLAKTCVLWDCSDRIYASDAEQPLSRRLDGLSRLLRRTYTAINGELNRHEMVQQRNGRAPILVLPYPQLLPGPDAACPSLFGVSKAELPQVHQFQADLNGQVEGAVKLARHFGQPVFYASEVENAFLPNHTLCDGRDSYVNYLRAAAEALIPGDFDSELQDFDSELQELLHPTAKGYRAMTASIIAWSNSPPGEVAADLPRQPPPAQTNPGDTVDQLLGTSTASQPQLQPAETPHRVETGTHYPLEVAGFAPHSQVELTVESAVRVLTLDYADDDGRVQTTVPIPADLASGGHTITVAGLDPNGKPHEIQIPLDVDASANPPTVLGLAGLALALLLMGGSLLAIERSRHNRQRTGTAKGRTHNADS
jgi:lysophospholipase L1-like esterase